MIEVTNQMADFVGAFAGALAVSIAMYLQFLKDILYAKAYIAAFYILGVLLILMNLRSTLDGTGYWAATQLVAYLTIIAIELTVVWDLKDGEARLISALQRRLKQ